ncbi:MAG: type I-B CRISPR-associated protein Cas7/Csh2 [Bryobacterales bacterium]|nr:type I-B CRISPR-associated protein Cas7/Csh2 [Bryobacterales bacterium]
MENNRLRRTELIFIYDVTDTNPNGDPNDENRPRMDVDSSRAKVSDVRLKRTIRDYLHVSRGEEIFCRQVEKPDGTIQEGKDRADDFYKTVGKQATSVLQKRDLIEKQLIAKCIDVRLFGGTVPVAATKSQEKDSSVTLTGAVQFAMGTSLHRVAPVFLKGTGAFASGQGKQKQTFREEYILPYALIAFYGIVNQEAANTTGMTAADAELLYEAIWNGTKNLITRSKIGQCPLLLMAVEYKDPNAYIGRLDRFLKLTENRTSEEPSQLVRRPDEVTLDLTSALDAIQNRKQHVERIRVAWDSRLPATGLKREDGQIKYTDGKITIPIDGFAFV